MQMELTIKFDETELGYVDDYLDGQSYKEVVRQALHEIRQRRKHEPVSEDEDRGLEWAEDCIIKHLNDNLPGGVERLG